MIKPNPKLSNLIQQYHVTQYTFFDEFLNEINGISPHTVALSLFCDHQENFITKNTGKEARPHLPPSLRNLYHSENIKLDEIELDFLAIKSINDIKESCTESSRSYVEEALPVT